MGAIQLLSAPSDTGFWMAERRIGLAYNGDGSIRDGDIPIIRERAPDRQISLNSLAYLVDVDESSLCPPSIDDEVDHGYR